MWFEPVQYPDGIGVGPELNFKFPVGFEKPPGGEIGSNMHVLNDHSYCCGMGGKICDIGEPNPKYVDQC